MKLNCSSGAKTNRILLFNFNHESLSSDNLYASKERKEKKENKMK